MIDFKAESKVLQETFGMNQKQTTKVLAVTITQVAYNVQKAIRAKIDQVFDRPTPFVQNSVFVKQAKVQGETVTAAEVGIKGSRAGKISPAHALFAEVAGGQRRLKGSESLLSGIAPDGRPEWIPGAGAELDAFGNIQGGTLKQILSAMQANRDVGTTSNSRVRGVSGLTRAQSERILKAREIDAYTKSRRFKDASESVKELMRVQARSRLADFKKRLNEDESRWKEVKTKIKTWLFAPGKNGKKRAIIYAFEWTQMYSMRLKRMVYKKDNLKPVLVFTKKQTYKPLLPIGKIAQDVFNSDIKQVWKDTAHRLFVKWNSK